MVLQHPVVETKKEEAVKVEAPKPSPTPVQSATYATGTASPAAKKILEEKGIPATQVKGNWERWVVILR